MNMHPSEVLENYWRMLLCGEVIGSVRGRVMRYEVSQSTVQRMDKEKKNVLEQLQKSADRESVQLDVTYIRTNAPKWKECSTWKDGKPDADIVDMNRKAVEIMLKALTLRFTVQAKAQPEVLLQAFQEFFEGATGRSIDIRPEAVVDENSDF
jgi:hypothetical protein